MEGGAGKIGPSAIRALGNPRGMGDLMATSMEALIPRSADNEP